MNTAFDEFERAVKSYRRRAAARRIGYYAIIGACSLFLGGHLVTWLVLGLRVVSQ